MWVLPVIGVVALVAAVAKFVPALGGGGTSNGKGKLPPPAGDPSPELPCHMSFSDGPWSGCVWRQVVDGDVRWYWRAWRTDPLVAGDAGPKQLTSLPAFFDTMDDARFAAWTALFEQGPVLITSKPQDRYGMKLATDGEILVANEAQYVNFASPIISAQSQQGETGTGLVVAVLLDAFPSFNPLRFKPAGGTLEAAGARVIAVGAPNPPVVARAIFNL